MGANNDEMFKICFNIFVGIGTAFLRASFQEVKICGPYTLSALLLLFFLLFSFFFFFLNTHRKLALVIEFLQNHNIQWLFLPWGHS